MLCPSCQKNEAIQHISLGVMNCQECQDRQSKLATPKESVEIIPERIKLERQERADSIEQPHIKGELNKRWVDLWGKKAAKERGFSDKEIKNAKYVYDGLRNGTTATHYYKDST